MRKYKKAAGLLAVSLVISMCSGCVMDREKSSESQAGETANLTDEDAEIKKAAKQDINEVHLRDKDTLYENDDETSVVTMYLTVSRGNVSENTAGSGRLWRDCAKCHSAGPGTDIQRKYTEELQNRAEKK